MVLSVLHTFLISVTQQRLCCPDDRSLRDMYPSLRVYHDYVSISPLNTPQHPYVYLCGSDGGADFSPHLSLTKGLVEVLIRLHGHGQDGAVGVAQLRAVGQLVEGHVLVQHRGADESEVRLFCDDHC